MMMLVFNQKAAVDERDTTKNDVILIQHKSSSSSRGITGGEYANVFVVPTA
jgi:hypothetical protein